MSSTQHRCVFVGNIPYDATEDQLIRICEEVGPVVSFRLVLDRETGKPKGYGFCEFRDEETALSARRNLQGYEINGRQLRVDFAENEKGSVDRNREQGRGGPGLAQNIDVHKQTGGPRAVRDPSFEQPIGRGAAASAAAVMAGYLGAPQVSTTMNQANMGINGQQSKGGAGGMAIGTDALTNHLAGMSRHQLFEILSQMKDLIQQNQRQARQILMANPQLTKALFQAQIMLGMVPQRMPLQNMATQAPQQQLAQQPQVQSVQTQPGQPPPIQNLSQLSAMQQAPLQQGQSQMINGQLHSQLQVAQQSQAMNAPLQSHQPSQNVEFQHSMQALQQSNSRTAKVLPLSQSAQPTGNNLGLRPQNPTLQHTQPQPSHPPPLPQQPRPPAAPSQLQPQITQGLSLQTPSGSQSQLPQPPFQQSSGMSQPTMGLTYQQMQPSLPNQPSLQQVFQGGPSQAGRGASMGAPSGSALFMKWNEPLASSVSMAESSQTGASMSIAGHMGPGPNLGGAGSSSAVGPSSNGAPPIQQGAIQSNVGHEGPGVVYSQGYGQPQIQSQPQQHTQQLPQMQVALESEQQKALLQQVMNLTPEQISSLPPEQRQQVLQLQQAFRSQST